MHVGYLEVLRVRRESPAANADDCGNLGKLAANAEAALNVYLNRLEPSSRKSRGMQRSIGTLRGVIPGFDAPELHFRARCDAVILVRARQVLRRHEKFAKDKERATRPGSGRRDKPDHAIFLKALTEAWKLITGQPPGRSMIESKNPFLTSLLKNSGFG
jgi:hypothetical protein